jgi:hypothetical protein
VPERQPAGRLRYPLFEPVRPENARAFSQQLGYAASVLYEKELYETPWLLSPRHVQKLPVPSFENPE